MDTKSGDGRIWILSECLPKRHCVYQRERRTRCSSRTVIDPSQVADLAQTPAAMWAVVIALGLDLSVSVSNRVTLGKVKQRLHEFTPTTEGMKDHVSSETGAVIDKVAAIVSDVQVANFKHADEIEAIKLACAKRHGRNGVT